MAEIVASALAQEGVSRASSYVSTKLEDKASRAHSMARLEMALSRLEFVLERTGKMPITYVSLIRSWNKFMCAYKDGVRLLNKHKQLQALEGHDQETGQVVVVRGSSSSYFQLIIARAARFSISSVAGLNKQSLSSSDVQDYEWYADCAERFATDVESICPLRRDTFFPYPFVRQLLEGKILSYERIQGRQRLEFGIRPFILEGRGVEAVLSCEGFDPERLDKCFSLHLVLRISESTDIVGTAIHCLRSSASLQNLVAQDAIMGEFTLLSNLLQGISASYSCGPDRWAECSRFWRKDPLCCQANGHVKSTMSSELSQNYFQEQTIYFVFSCYIPALEYRLPSASNGAGGNVMTDVPPLRLTVFFAPHFSSSCDDVLVITETNMGGKREPRPFGSIQQTVDMVRSRSVDFLINQPEMTMYTACWFSRHGWARFEVQKPSTDLAAARPKARGSCNTRSGAKRKR